MSAFIYSFIFLFTEAGHAGETGGFTHFWNTYLNYPGFEAWKFFNLAVFVALLVYLLKKPLSQTFKAKREVIRAELIKAEEERQSALQKLTETEAKLAGLEREVAAIREKAAQEAAAEKSRIAEQAAFEINKLRQQGESEISRTAHQAKTKLRKFSAEESIRRAEEIIKTQINAEADARIVKTNIQSIGGLD
jgi:F-type H+-transporting ATPase subunit b